MIDQRRSNVGLSIPFLCVIFMFIIVGVWKTSVLSISFTGHAKTSHVEQVNEIDNCFNNGNVSNTFKMANGRWGQYCENGETSNAWRIYECVKGEKVVVTQFKQRVRKLANYIKNHGMVQETIPCS